MENKGAKNKIEEYAGKDFEIRVTSTPDLPLWEKKKLLQKCINFLLLINNKK